MFFLAQAPPRSLAGPIEQALRRRLWLARRSADRSAPEVAGELGLPVPWFAALERGAETFDVGVFVRWSRAVDVEPWRVLREVLDELGSEAAATATVPEADDGSGAGTGGGHVRIDEAEQSVGLLPPSPDVLDGGEPGVTEGKGPDVAGPPVVLPRSPGTAVPRGGADASRPVLPVIRSTDLHRILSDAWRTGPTVPELPHVSDLARAALANGGAAVCLTAAASPTVELTAALDALSVLRGRGRALWVARRGSALDEAASVLRFRFGPGVALRAERPDHDPGSLITLVPAQLVSQALDAKNSAVAGASVVALDGHEPAFAPGIRQLLDRGQTVVAAYSILDGPPSGREGPRGSDRWAPLRREVELGGYSGLRWAVLPDSVVPGDLPRANLGYENQAVRVALCSPERLATLRDCLEPVPEGSTRWILAPSRGVALGVSRFLREHGVPARVRFGDEEERGDRSGASTEVHVRPPTRRDGGSPISEIVVVGPVPVRGMVRGLLCAMRRSFGAEAPVLRWLWGGVPEIEAIELVLSSLGARRIDP